MILNINDACEQQQSHRENALVKSVLHPRQFTHAWRLTYMKGHPVPETLSKSNCVEQTYLANIS